jgi:hypothetical protein
MSRQRLCAGEPIRCSIVPALALILGARRQYTWLSHDGLFPPLSWLGLVQGRHQLCASPPKQSGRPALAPPRQPDRSRTDCDYHEDQEGGS